MSPNTCRSAQGDAMTLSRFHGVDFERVDSHWRMHSPGLRREAWTVWATQAPIRARVLRLPDRGRPASRAPVSVRRHSPKNA